MGGFSGAVLLAVFAVMMAVESMARLVNPVEIAFNQAIFVAVIGLVVNGLSMFILGYKDEHHHDPDPGHDGHNDYGHQHHHHDYNLRSAYLQRMPYFFIFRHKVVRSTPSSCAALWRWPPVFSNAASIRWHSRLCGSAGVAAGLGEPPFF